MSVQNAHLESDSIVNGMKEALKAELFRKAIKNQYWVFDNGDGIQMKSCRQVIIDDGLADEFETAMGFSIYALPSIGTDDV